MAVKQCTKCGETKPLSEFYKHPQCRFGVEPTCKLCRDAKNKAWFLKNKEAHNKRSTENYHKNKERHAERCKAWAIANRDKMRAYVKKYYAANKEKEAVRRLKYEQQNPAQMKVNRATRRARKLGAVGSHTKAQVLSLLDRQRGRCAACKKTLKQYHADHVIPLARGGTNYIENIQILCPSCNSKKHAKDPIVFMQEQGFLI